MPQPEEVRLSGSAGRYLIAHRRGTAARGLRPMSANEMQSAVKGIPGVEILKVVKAARQVSAFSATAGESSDTLVVKMDEERAQLVRKTVPPNLIMERDAFLGIEPPAPDEDSLGLAAAPGAAGIAANKVRIKVIGEGDQPLQNVTVSLTGIGFGADGLTDKSGLVNLDLLTMPGQPARSIFVRAAPNHWDYYLESPNLNPASLNVIRLRSLKETVPGFPDTYQYGWGAKAMGLDQLDAARFSGEGIKIGIIDSGLDNTHPLLQHVKQGTDFTGSAGGWTEDVIGHGTHCAGTIGARGGGPPGLRGFAPQAEIHVYKIFPGGHFSDLLEALDACLDDEIDVVNMSLGSSETSEAVEQVLEECAVRGIVCIAAAGNAGGAVQYPASSRNVMAISAIGHMKEFPADTWDARTAVPGQIATDGTFSPTFTNFGPEVDVCAPGVAIISTVPGGRYQAQSGTSMASPYVAGLAALMLAHHPLFKTTFRERNRDRVVAVADLMRGNALPMPFTGGRSGSGLPRTNILIAGMAQSAATPGVRPGIGLAPAAAAAAAMSPFFPMPAYGGIQPSLAPLFAWR